MSILTDFIATVAPIAQEVIGTDTISIGGGTAIAFTPSEERHSKDYETGGFEQESTTDVMILTSVFIAAYPDEITTYEGKSATIGSRSWRVRRLENGASFVSINLTSTNKSA